MERIIVVVDTKHNEREAFVFKNRSLAESFMGIVRGQGLDCEVGGGGGKGK